MFVCHNSLQQKGWGELLTFFIFLSRKTQEQKMSTDGNDATEVPQCQSLDNEMSDDALGGRAFEVLKNIILAGSEISVTQSTIFQNFG